MVHAHVLGAVVKHTADGVRKEQAEGRGKSAFGIGMMGLSVVLFFVIGPLAVIPFVIGLTAYCCQEKKSEPVALQSVAAE